jgi:phosphoenolpyruvate carboxylase
MLVLASERACSGARQVSCDAYRQVVRGDPRFIEFFGAATPVSELGRMNIGSRPAKRKAAGR